MLLAAIDLGSNSFRLEIGRAAGSHIARIDTKTGKATVIDARILPAPVSELPMFGSRVETIALANRQVDRYRSVVGRADWICWNGHSWTVSVRFDTSVTMRRGGRLPGCYSPVTMVREFGRGERPFSDMSADEVRTLFEACRSIAV